MSAILNIETSTEVCSVAISENGKCLYYEQNNEGQQHTHLLAPFVDRVVSFADNHAIPIDAVAVSMGPGSYTGLRIGVSTAKGFCYGREIPLIALPTLKILSVPVLLYHELPEEALLCPMLDARRMEVYSAVYDRALNEIEPVQPKIIEEGAFQQYLDKGPVYFFGNGSGKCKEIIVHENAHFINDIVPLAKYMFPLAEKAFVQEEWADLAYFEPSYLKPFVATKAKKIL